MSVNRENSTETATVRHEGRRYRIERTLDACGPGTVREYWPGYGVIGSQKRWLGGRFSVRPQWYAAVNPTGRPYEATGRRQGFASRRAAIRWLLAAVSPAGHEVIRDA